MAERSGLRRRLRRLAHPLEALGALIVLGVFRLTPLDAASAAGGWVGRTLGPRLPVTRRALHNLRLAMPELDDEARHRIVRDMWDNLGRMLGEYPHNAAITRDAGRGGRVEIAGLNNIAALRDSGERCVLVSGHLANFEIFARSCEAVGMGYAQIYRAPNNPLIHALLKWLRSLPDDDIMTKGPSGARKALSVLKEGRRLGILIDQKMNDGIPVPFFGRDAMTAPAAAQLALRFECPLVPVRLERLGGCRFRLTFFPPLDLPRTSDRVRDAAAMMGAVNALLEAWIRKRPGQWFWPHRRWPES
ncbi:MAG: lauroyl acyltransferase [Alphaproteobacteria bacterium]|nr:lauroyl acyltransferase [Alphaproteobacteria bacterium]